jgi:hypothetical protein
MSTRIFGKLYVQVLTGVVAGHEVAPLARPAADAPEVVELGSVSLAGDQKASA